MESMHSLNEAHSCRRARDMGYAAKEGAQPENYFRAVIIIAVIRWALILYLRVLAKEPDKKEVMEYMATRYPECRFKIYQQMQQQLLQDHNYVMRYLQDEKRKPWFPKSLPVQIGSRVYDVHCHVAFPCGDQIELVYFKIGKPNMTQTGRGNAFQRDMFLYALQLYGRALGFKYITSSIYFLKKSSDRQYWNQNDQNFFGSGDNIIQITDIYDGKPTPLDEKMAPLIAKLDAGIDPEEQDEETCAYCENFDLCKYKKAPLRIEIAKPVAGPAVTKFTYSEQQQKVLDFRSGIARVIAGAGSGKTEVITERVARMILSGVRPETILMVTFSRSAAKEMKRRVEKKVGREIPELTVMTFNAFEYEIVKRCWQTLNFKRPPQVINEVEQSDIIAKQIKENPILEWTGNSFLNVRRDGSSYRGCRGAIEVAAAVYRACKLSKAETGMIDFMKARTETTYEEINDSALQKLISYYEEYEKELKDKGLLDFDDQEIMAFEVMDNDPGYIGRTYQYEHILVDEYQDTDQGQFDLLKRLRHQLKNFKSMMIVGDDYQAIYRFRNTDPKFFIKFEELMCEPVTDIVLDYNYRSTPQICEFATQIVEPNRNKVAKQLRATRPSGVPVIVNGFYKANDEIKHIVKQVKLHLQNGVRPEDICIIAYSKRELQKIADALTKEGIPSMFGAPEPMMDNSRIRAILAFARVIRDKANTKDALTAANALCDGTMLEKTPAEIEAAVNEVCSRAESIRLAPTEQKEKFIEFIDEISMDDEAVENFKESLENKDFEEVIDYCRAFSLYGGGVEYRRTESYPGVALMTAHSSKGLEWPVVINTITKYQKDTRMHVDDVEETRRLIFVSATRARDELIITGLYANGTKAKPVENRFLKELFEIQQKTWNYMPA